MKRETGLGWVIALLLMLFVCSGVSLGAEVMPKSPNLHFNDYAGLMKDPQTGPSLEVQLEDFEKNTSTQIVVAIYPTMQSDSDIDDYTTRVAQSWHVGQKGKDNGVVVFVFAREHKVSIKTGYGLEGALPDATCKEMIDHDVVPAFRAGDYDSGMKNVVQSICLAVQGEYVLPSSIVVPHVAMWHDYWRICCCALVLPGFFILVWLLPKPSGTQYRSGGGSSVGWAIAGGILSSVLSSGGGGGGGGGFSGGGGSFGGGGASGSW